MDYLSKIISIKPKPTLKESIGNRKKSLLIEVTDKVYRFDKSARGLVSWIVGIMFIFFASFGLLIDDDLIGTLIIILIFGIPGIFSIIYGFVAPKKEMVYDRLKGVITVTRVFRKSVDIPFDTGYGVRVYSNTSPGVISSQLSFVSSKKKPRVGGILSQILVDDVWSFTVWYMDKNRPLPPGDAFDAYRERDFERRKAEGFPKPLYPSKIKTPEATKEQQQERERIGGW